MLKFFQSRPMQCQGHKVRRKTLKLICLINIQISTKHRINTANIDNQDKFLSYSLAFHPKPMERVLLTTWL